MLLSLFFVVFKVCVVVVVVTVDVVVVVIIAGSRNLTLKFV